MQYYSFLISDRCCFYRWAGSRFGQCSGPAADPGVAAAASAPAPACADACADSGLHVASSFRITRPVWLARRHGAANSGRVGTVD